MIMLMYMSYLGWEVSTLALTCYLLETFHGSYFASLLQSV